MGNRYMRVICFFDLPTLTLNDKRAYRNFRKFLIKSGFKQEQESVYSKLAQNSLVANAIVNNLRKNKPPEGLVQVLRVTENQYVCMEFIVGKSSSNILDSDERCVIL